MAFYLLFFCLVAAVQANGNTFGMQDSCNPPCDNSTQLCVADVCVSKTCVFNVSGQVFDLWPLASQAHGNDTIYADHGVYYAVNPCGPLLYFTAISNNPACNFCYQGSSAVCYIETACSMGIGQWPPDWIGLDNDGNLKMMFSETNFNVANYANLTFVCSSSTSFTFLETTNDVNLFTYNTPVVCSGQKRKDKKTFWKTPLGISLLACGSFLIIALAVILSAFFLWRRSKWTSGYEPIQ